MVGVTEENYFQRCDGLSKIPWRTMLAGPIMCCLATFALPPEAGAQTFACNGTQPGQRMIGMAPGGPGLAPTPLCVRDDSSGNAPTEDKPSDPAGSMAAAIMAMSKIMLQDAVRMTDDPLYLRLRGGYWQYFKPAPGVKRGDYCMAAYGTLDGIITLSGPGGDYRGAMLSFTGTQLPRPKKQTLITVTLDDGDGRPSTVRAINYATSGTKLGTIAFAVPSAGAMLDGMKDITNYRLTFGHKQSFEIGWKNADEARRKLKQCISGRGA